MAAASAGENVFFYHVHHASWIECSGAGRASRRWRTVQRGPTVERPSI